MKISFAGLGVPDRGAYAVAIAEGKVLSKSASDLDKAHKGLVKKAIAASRFTGKRHQFLTILAPSGMGVDRIVLMGVGKPAELTAFQAEALGGNLYAYLAKTSDRDVFVSLDAVSGMKFDAAKFAALFANGARLRSYRFDKYRTKQKPDDKPSVERLIVQCAKAAAAKAAYAKMESVSDGVVFTRDLVNEPPNVIYPQSFADQLRQLGKLGVKIEVLDEKQIQKLGMGALWGVAQGSAFMPRVVLMRWDGGKKNEKSGPIALVGKGVTFDTGGISIKPSQGMEDMKWDMAGAGAVAGAMMALAKRKAKANVIGAVGLVENMPSGTAQRPSDIVKSLSGQTIEVLNTDAEGRLVLADVVWHVQEKFKPRLIVDLATLTGAIVVALGSEYAGLFSNNDGLASKLAKAGEGVGELLWRMPLCEGYDRDIDGFQADVKNIGSGRGAGSCTAAHFIKRFIKDGVDWAHLDIAGTAWAAKDNGPTPKGASAFGVRLLDRFIADNFE